MTSNVTEEDIDRGTAPAEESSQLRTIFINAPQSQKYKTNEISTAKYNFITFLPKFLFEQFRIAKHGIHVGHS